MKHQVDLDEFKRCVEYLEEINKHSPDEIEVFKDGKFQYINPESIKEWKFVGLNTVSFIKDIFFR